MILGDTVLPILSIGKQHRLWLPRSVESVVKGTNGKAEELRCPIID